MRKKEHKISVLSKKNYICILKMVIVAQLVRASVCGTEGRGFESHHSPESRIC